MFVVIDDETEELRRFHEIAKVATSVSDRVYLLRLFTYRRTRRVKHSPRRKVPWHRLGGDEHTRPKCWACGDSSKKRHHIIPIGQGGSNQKLNIVPLCHRCETGAHGGNKIGSGKPSASLLRVMTVSPKVANEREAGT